MQIFEVIQLKEYPYMKTSEIVEGETVADILTEENEDKVFLLVDHDTKRILTYNGTNSSLRLQFYGGELARKLRTELKLFYRVHPLNLHNKTHEMFTEIINKPLGPGRASSIGVESFSESSRTPIPQGDLSIHAGLKNQQALEYLNELPELEDYQRKFLILGNNLYSDVETTEEFLNKENVKVTQEKLGALTRGFTFFESENDQAIRFLIKNRIVQGIEIYSTKDTNPKKVEIDVPIFYEQRFRNEGKMEDLLNAFDIPEEWTEDG